MKAPIKLHEIKANTAAAVNATARTTLFLDMPISEIEAVVYHIDNTRQRRTRFSEFPPSGRKRPVRYWALVAFSSLRSRTPFFLDRVAFPKSAKAA